jgi:FecR protein
MKIRARQRAIKIDESFDESNEAAVAIRSLVPPDTSMDEEVLDRMVRHLLSLQRRHLYGRQAGHHRRLRTASLVAAAILVFATVLVGVIVPAFMSGSKPAPTGSIAVLGSLRGTVSVKPPGGKWQAASERAKMTAGWTVKTGKGSFVSVTFPEGSIMRVSDESEAAVAAMTHSSITVEHIAGNTYHRVHTGTRYAVTNSGVRSTALGTAFNVDNRKAGKLEILSVEHAVEVEIGKHQPIRVAEGEVMLVSLKQGKEAVKQPVSRERLADGRLCASVQSDAQAGYSTGIYGKLDVPLASQPEEQAPEDSSQPVVLNGTVGDQGVSLDWTFSTPIKCNSLVLLRSEHSEPGFPASEIARYSDTSISSATDDSIDRGHTYQYRLAALLESGEVSAYSNTVVIFVDSGPALQDVSITLSASAGPNGITLEWGVSGATTFTGFVVERVIENAPGGSSTPVGTTTTKTVDSTNVFFTFQDNSVSAGYSYTYRIGLVVNGAVVYYSTPKTVDMPGR